MYKLRTKYTFEKAHVDSPGHVVCIGVLEGFLLVSSFELALSFAAVATCPEISMHIDQADEDDDVAPVPISR